MKSIIVLLIITTITYAEPQRYRVVGLQSQRQEAEPIADSETREQTTPRSQVPYPPSGWRPSVPRFILPARLLAPTQTFGALRNTFGIPYTKYGVPTSSEARTNDVETTTTTEQTISKNENVETLETEALNELEQKEVTDDIESEIGAYYILLPGSTLQRVDYRTENDARNMAYTVRLQYKNEQPAPVYLYSPQQYIKLAQV